MINVQPLGHTLRRPTSDDVARTPPGLASATCKTCSCMRTRAYNGSRAGGSFTDGLRFQQPMELVSFLAHRISRSWRAQRMRPCSFCSWKR
jgi:hypothetical protein